jgi:transketolase
VERVSQKAQFVREETIRLISVAKVGHYASAFSCAELLASLYYDVLQLRPEEPGWVDRDRFLFGKGHAAVAQYAILADLGFFPPELLDSYTRLGSAFGDHPDMRRVPGCDFSSGSLGHALSAAVGMALGARIQGHDFRVFTLLGDGELHEGQIWEAAMAAGHYRLHRLVAIVDRNEFSLDGRVEEIISLEPLTARWEAFGWSVVEVDGHNVAELLTVLRQVAADEETQRPVVVIARTVKGKGVSFMESEFGWHLGYLAPRDEDQALAEIRGTA